MIVGRFACDVACTAGPPSLGRADRYPFAAVPNRSAPVHAVLLPLLALWIVRWLGSDAEGRDSARGDSVSGLSS